MFPLQHAHYLGTDISDSQLQGAYSNIKAAGLVGKIDLLKASVTGKSLARISDITILNNAELTTNIFCVCGGGNKNRASVASKVFLFFLQNR